MNQDAFFPYAAMAGGQGDDLDSLWNDLRRMDKLVAVSQLAFGVAHEIRNPLAAIQWNLEGLRSKHPEDQEIYDVMLAELQRIDSTVGQLLALAKSNETSLRLVDPAELLHSIVKLMSVQASHSNVTLHVHTCEVPELECDENQLKQVFINILMNGIEAMPTGGALEISISSRTPHPCGEPTDPHPSSPCGKTWVHFQFRDEGTGIEPERLSKVGTPFFTTKPHGTGLGLMISRKIIEEHGGELQISSAVGQGTTIDIALPARRTETPTTT